jgi:ribosome-binding protein aMBF1 (putative translation factor)
MTPERFRECVEHIGWSMRSLADQLGMHETRTRRWADGSYPVPKEIERWLEKLAAVHERYPAPQMASRRGKWFKREQESAEA